VADITRRLHEVLLAEGSDAPDEALRTIARRADGGMRDAMSLLDQVLALTGGEISQEAVRRVLGLVEEERYLELFDILRERRHGSVFSFVEGLLDEGYDMAEFHRGLIEALRALLRLRLPGGDEALDWREDQLEAYLDRAEAFSAGDLVRMLAQATELEASGSLRRSAHPRLLLEMLLLRMSYQDRTVELEALLRGLGGEGPPPLREEGNPPAPLRESPQPPAPRPTAAPEPETEPGPGPGTLAEAWEQMLEVPTGLPKGVLPFLRAAGREITPDGEIRLAIPPGPALERLGNPAVIGSLERALAARGHGSARIVMVEDEGRTRGPGRITQETVRKGRLQELVDKEPAFGEAVKELDLELLD
jgi:DNA polymerase III gamma/tau subunit